MSWAAVPRLLLTIMVGGLGAACGSDDGNDDARSNGAVPVSEGGVPVEVKQFTFIPSEITASAGEVIFSVKNTGTLEHNLTIDEPEFSLSVFPGKTRSRKVELEAGTYDIYCSVTGHRLAGMEGELTVN
ncbi:MAG: cupredoxin domain-containing protein [Acidimicrobiia bacterium]